jgi:hypothetical protein
VPEHQKCRLVVALIVGCQMEPNFVTGPQARRIRSEAAKTLNINRQLLYAKLKRYGLGENDETSDEGD